MMTEWNGESVLNCNGCESRHIEIEELNGELMVRGTGRIYSGTVFLQLFNGESGMEKKIFVLENGNEECQFIFNESERENSEKILKAQIQSDNSVIHYILICYSILEKKGTSYLLPNFDELEKWSKKLNIYDYEILDCIGQLVSNEKFGN